MADDPEEVINTELARRIDEYGASPIPVVIETEFGIAGELVDDVIAVEGVQLGDSGVVSAEYIAAVVPESVLDDVAAVPGVVKIHQDQLVGVKDTKRSALPLLHPETDPLEEVFSTVAFKLGGGEDKYVGRVGISPVEQPRLNVHQFGNPLKAVASLVDGRLDTNATGSEFVPTSESVAWMLDGEATVGFNGLGSRLAVIDTGHTPLPDVTGSRRPHLESLVPGEPPLDFNTHGSWCTNTAVGSSSRSVWGRVQGVADGAEHAHFKALNSFPGFGKTSWILGAMERAHLWGADVISMSLGGFQQGSLDEDPYARFIRRRCKENLGEDEGSIFVCAAGNSGPGKWEIGSPGVSEKAITVASWSLTDEAPSFYSSRGPQGDWYRDNPEKFEEHKREYGVDEFVKPDVCAPGGGRETEEKDRDRGELLHQAATGLMDGLHDGIKSARTQMMGTSMACPHVAGLIARLYDAGIIKNAAEFKQVVKENSEVDYYQTADSNANVAEDEKNIAVGFGPVSESVFDP